MARNRLYPPSVKPGIPRLGIKPKGWIETTFGNVLQVIQRPAVIDDNVEYQLVTAKRGRGGIVPRESLTGKKILTKVQYYIAKDDFLISKRQIVHGACGIVPVTLDSAIVSGEYSVLRVKEGLLLKYLDYFSHTDYFQMACFQSSVGVDVEKMIFDLKNWLEIRIYLPPLPEQEKIVEILETWDKAIAKTENIISLLQERKKGLMERLITGKERFSPFIDDWITVRLDERVKQFIVPMRDKPPVFRGEIPWCRIEDFDGVYLKESKSGRMVDEQIIQEMKLKVYPIGTVLCSCSADLGRCAITSVPLITNQTFIGLVAGEDLDNLFLYYYLSFNARELQRISSGTTIAYLSREEFEKFRVRIPPSLAEQQRIAEVLFKIDSEIELTFKKLDALNQQKKGLMQRLLTGKVIVKV